MTSANSPYVSHARLTIFPSLTKHFFKWRDRRRLAHARRKLSEMPDYLLRDAGLEHLRVVKPDPTFPHRMP